MGPRASQDLRSPSPIMAPDESAYKDIVFTNIIFLVCIIKPEGAHNYLCVYQIHQNWEKRLSMKWFDSVIKVSVEEFAHF